MSDDRDADLPHILGEFPTVTAALDYAGRSKGELRFHNASGDVEQLLSYHELRDAARDFAYHLKGAGFGKGDRIALAAATVPEFLIVFYGCQYASVVPCPIPHKTNIGDRRAYSEQLAGMLRTGGVRAIVALPGQDDLAGVAQLADVSFTSYASLMEAKPDADIDAPNPEDVAYIQFSSGSTSQPKGVVITHRAVSLNAEAILKYGIKLRSNDRAFSWLPFYHDMGLVGFSIAPVFGQCSVDYMSALSFARRPLLWLRLMSLYGSTITYSPSFGYKLAALRYSSDPLPLDLSLLRIAGIGGDMVRPDILARFSEALKETGFSSTAFLPSYGMAEATLAISFGTAGSQTQLNIIDKMLADQTGHIRMLPPSDIAPGKTRELVSCGFPLPGIDLAVVDDKDRPLPDCRVGRVMVRSPSLMMGYVNDAEETARILRSDGFMDTGDLGYLRDGQIIITGRAKDLILYRGRNIWPEDIEWTAEHISPLSLGDTAAFALDNESGEDAVILLVQCRIDDEAVRSSLIARLHAAITQAIGISCKIVLIPPRSLPKTSSGKLARSQARSLYTSGQLQTLQNN